MKKTTDVVIKLRGEIEDMVRLFGLVETEEMLGIVVLRIRKTGIEGIK